MNTSEKAIMTLTAIVLACSLLAGCMFRELKEEIAEEKISFCWFLIRLPRSRVARVLENSAVKHASVYGPSLAVGSWIFRRDFFASGQRGEAVLGFLIQVNLIQFNSINGTSQ